MNPSPNALVNAGDEIVPGFEKPNKLAKTLIASFAPQTRKAFLGCWGMHRHLSGMDSPLALASMVAVWIRDWGLAESDAEACLRSMCDPESMQLHKFASDLTTDLANAATRHIKRRAAERAQAERRGPEIDPDSQARVQSMLGEITKRMAT